LGTKRGTLKTPFSGLSAPDSNLQELLPDRSINYLEMKFSIRMKIERFCGLFVIDAQPSAALSILMNQHLASKCPGCSRQTGIFAK
jgi:hypothetical protein